MTPYGNQYAFKGDAVGYWAVHKRLAVRRGRAKTYTCPCGNPATEWVFDEPEGFSTDLSRYTAMCRSCHRAQDRVSGRFSRKTRRAS